MYDHVWDYVNPDAKAQEGQTEVTTLPPEPQVDPNVQESTLRMQLEPYRRWEKKVKAIKTLDGHVMKTGAGASVSCSESAKVQLLMYRGAHLSPLAPKLAPSSGRLTVRQLGQLG
jgi:hypothetical protein